MREMQNTQNPDLCGIFWEAWSSDCRAAVGSDAGPKWRASGNKYPLSLSGQAGARQDKHEQSDSEFWESVKQPLCLFSLPPFELSSLPHLYMLSGK